MSLTPCIQAMKLAHGLKLNDSDTAAAYRKKYNYAPANQYPTIVACDTGTSNAYWSGELMGESFGNYTKLLTSGKYVHIRQHHDFTISKRS